MHAGRVAERGVCGSVQGLFSGVGLGLGGLVGGFIYYSYGAPVVFASAGIVLVAGWCLCASAQALVTCCHSLRNEGWAALGGCSTLHELAGN